jgi:ATP-dependent Clp protease protease subunit
MIKKIKEFITSGEPEEDLDKKKIIFLDPSTGAPEPDLRCVGLFSDVVEDKVGDLVHALLYLDELNRLSDEENKRPIKFYISTYGGSADDMFALYDVLRQIRKENEVQTIGLGKVMSAGVLLLAAGTKGKRQIGKNCRIMLHSVMGGNQGALYNMLNELEAIEQLQDMYCDCLLDETTMTRSKLKKMIERKVNVYLSAEEAVQLGIADIII